ncbi:hypothetical protein NC653_038010 [Populus alba x Populus x berolinensis]|uniref:Uncharacterized protein n=1 Tax=Populus alba x Populus x berolinensis TaxID=444605 RepID=A0AAD6LFK8_9ROSI|nr:hypothetical protein NC653_038010 [Populus alba x Populus x berolinensis]
MLCHSYLLPPHFTLKSLSEILKSTGLWFHLASAFPLFPCKMWLSNSFQASVYKGFGVMALPDCELRVVLSLLV